MSSSYSFRSLCLQYLSIRVKVRVPPFTYRKHDNNDSKRWEELICLSMISAFTMAGPRSSKSLSLNVFKRAVTNLITK